MIKYLSIAILLSLSLPALAGETLLAGRIERVILEPEGTQACPKRCPALATPLPDGRTSICLPLGGGMCETVEIKVEKDFLGERPEGSIWKERHYIGEFGPTFAARDGLIVVHQNGGRPRWTPAVHRDGQVLVHPGRFTGLAKSATHDWFKDDTNDKLPVEQLIERLRSGK